MNQMSSGSASKVTFAIVDIGKNVQFTQAQNIFCQLSKGRSSHPEVFLSKGVLKICSKFTGEHPCQSVISIKLLCNFIEITLRHGCSPVNLPHIFTISTRCTAPFPRNIFGWLLLERTKCL